MSELTRSSRTRSGFFGTVLSIAEALVIAAVIRTLLFQPFDIPSGSMEPTLLVGDYLFVSKYSYGYSHYSIPFSPPLFSGRVFAFHRPQRGDVVVFRLPTDTSVDYVKRVIGSRSSASAPPISSALILAGPPRRTPRRCGFHSGARRCPTAFPTTP